MSRIKQINIKNKYFSPQKFYRSQKFFKRMSSRMRDKDKTLMHKQHHKDSYKKEYTRISNLSMPQWRKN